MGRNIQLALRYILYIAVVFFGLDILFVVLGSGMSLEFFGYQVRSTAIDFPVIGFLVAGLATLIIVGQWREASLVFGALITAGLIVELSLRVLDHPLSKDHIDYAVWYKSSD
jgi:hypothetical protein